jgi:hypothetical protein
VPLFTAVILLEPHGAGTKYTAIAIHGDEEGAKNMRTWASTTDGVKRSTNSSPSRSSCEGHSIRSHPSARNSISKLSRCAGRTLHRAEREESQSAVPSHRVIARLGTAELIVARLGPCIALQCKAGTDAQTSGSLDSAWQSKAGGAWPSLSGQGRALPVMAWQGQHGWSAALLGPSRHSSPAPAKLEAGAGQLDYVKFSSFLARLKCKRYESSLDRGS